MAPWRYANVSLKHESDLPEYGDVSLGVLGVPSPDVITTCTSILLAAQANCSAEASWEMTAVWAALWLSLCQISKAAIRHDPSGAA